MQAEHFVIEMLVTVLQRGQPNMPAYRILIEHDGSVGAFRLRFDVVMLRRQHALETKTVTLLTCKSGTLVE